MEEWLKFRHQASLKRAHRVLVQWLNLAGLGPTTGPSACPRPAVAQSQCYTRCLK